MCLIIIAILILTAPLWFYLGIVILTYYAEKQKSEIDE